MILSLLTIISFCQLLINVEAAATLQKLVPDDAVDGDYFGISVSVYGTHSVIGAWTQDNHGISQFGAAYIFDRETTTNTWSQTAKLNTSDDTTQALGFAVDIYGTSVVVGARHNDQMYGAAYVFELDTGTDTWTRTAKLQRNPNSGASYFGNDVSIYDQYIAIGTRNEAAYIFKRDAQGNSWTQTAKLVSDDNVDGDYFASSLALYGNYLVVGADSTDKNATTYTYLGSAYIFELDTGTWTQTAKLTPDERIPNSFGSSVAIYGTTVLIGARNDDSIANNAGSAYIFDWDITNGWTQSVKLVANDGTSSDSFGYSVALYDMYAVIGARGDGKGSAYVFELDSNGWTQTAKLEPTSGQNYDKFGCSVSVYDKYAMVGMSGDVTGSAHATVLIDYADTFTSNPSKAPTRDPSASPSRSPNESSGTSPPSAAPVDTGNPSASPSQAPNESSGTSGPSQSPNESSGTSPPSAAPVDTGNPSASPSQSPNESSGTSSPTRTPSSSPADSSASTTEMVVSMDDQGNSQQMKAMVSFVPSWFCITVAIFISY